MSFEKDITEIKKIVEQNGPPSAQDTDVLTGARHSTTTLRHQGVEQDKPEEPITEQGVMPNAEGEELLPKAVRTSVSLKNRGIKAQEAKVNEEGPEFKAASPEELSNRPEPTDRKKFMVAAVSSNTNSFGLHNVVMVAKDGEAWSVKASPYNLPEKGMTYVPHSIGNGEWGWADGWGFEIPERLSPDAPPEVVREVWGV